MQLGFVVHFDENVDRVAPRLVDHLRDARIVESRNDDQHRIGTICRGLRDLVTRAQKVFAQNRQPRNAADDVEIGEVAQKMVGLGQYADRVGAGAVIIARDLGGVERPNDEPERRRRAFDLGNNGRTLGAGQRRTECAPLGAAVERALANGGERLAQFIGLADRNFCGVELFEHIHA